MPARCSSSLGEKLLAQNSVDRLWNNINFALLAYGGLYTINVALKGFSMKNTSADSVVKRGGVVSSKFGETTTTSTGTATASRDQYTRGQQGAGGSLLRSWRGMVVERQYARGALACIGCTWVLDFLYAQQELMILSKEAYWPTYDLSAAKPEDVVEREANEGKDNIKPVNSVFELPCALAMAVSSGVAYAVVWRVNRLAFLPFFYGVMRSDNSLSHGSGVLDLARSGSWMDEAIRKKEEVAGLSGASA